MDVNNTNKTKPIVPPKPTALNKAPQLSAAGVNLPAGVPSLGKVVNTEDTYVLPAGVSDLGAVVADEAPVAAASVTPEAPKSAGKSDAFKGIKNFAASALNRAKNAGITTVVATLIALDTGLNKVNDAVKSVVALISAAIEIGLNYAKSGVNYAKSGVSNLVSLVSSETKTKTKAKDTSAATKSANKILAAYLNSIKNAGKGTLTMIFIAIDTGLNKITSAVSSLSSANKGNKA